MARVLQPRFSFTFTFSTFSTLCLVAALLFPVGCGSEDKEPDAGLVADARVAPNLTHDQLIDACIRISACEVDRKPKLEDCLDNLERVSGLGQRDLYWTMLDCVNKGKGDCKIIRECMGFAGRPKKCVLSSFTPRCEGDVAYNCDQRVTGDWEQGLDCSLGGLTCIVKKTGTTVGAVCGAGKCDTKYKANCTNKKLYKCVGGSIEINDCPSQQLQCRDPKVGSCEGTGRSCAKITPYCKGSILHSCIYDFESEIDCSKALGSKRCDSNTEACVGTGTECGATQSFFDDCNGDDHFVVCIDRKRRQISCKTLGFLKCEKAKTGYGAYCKAEFVYN
jgi:hypothetical protein